MAYYRNISMAFWTDNKVQDEFTPEDKYFYLYLLTNPQTNLCGCYEISFKEIERETGYNRETINKLLFRFQYILNVIAFNEENKEVFLLNWHKYNLSTSEKTISGARKVVAYVKTEEFRNELNYLLDCYETKEPYICRINGAYMGHTYPTQASVSVSVSDTVSESDKDLKNSKDIDVVKNDNERYVDESYHESSKIHKTREKPKVVYFPDNEELNTSFNDFLDMRKKIKKPATDRAIQLAISKLDKLSGGDSQKKIDIINQSVLNCWQDLYPLKEEQTKKQAIDWSKV